MQGLMLHCGARNVSREDLYKIPTPEPTRTWHPVPHADIADLVRGSAKTWGYHVTREEYGVNPCGTKLFGVLYFHAEGNCDYTRALGFRNSHDKSLAVGLTVGVNVFVCDNLCFGGETVIQRKHTSRIDVRVLIEQAFATLEGKYDALEGKIEDLEDQPVCLTEAKLLVVRAAEEGAIPSCDILPVLDRFRNPEHPEFSARNRWSLYNSFTETAKKYTAARADQCYRRLGSIFGLG